ncbi:hypothetical protein AB205_0022870 [Aquarana catesbeiana]|uniref:Uncharacterized protein n=1 Tax=Aquarana catesbeiana TaxID=8400 RepID=A0A2G9S479_AQUCT|nr:hypothetical protein AB205_0022870 [Aquarana catesbeiana]
MKGNLPNETMGKKHLYLCLSALLKCLCNHKDLQFREVEHLPLTNGRQQKYL